MRGVKCTGACGALRLATHVHTVRSPPRRRRAKAADRATELVGGDLFDGPATVGKGVAQYLLSWRLQGPCAVRAFEMRLGVGASAAQESRTVRCQTENNIYRTTTADTARKAHHPLTQAPGARRDECQDGRRQASGVT